MTYDAQEVGLQTGKPVELFTFTRGNQVERFTSADRDIDLQTAPEALQASLLLHFDTVLTPPTVLDSSLNRLPVTPIGNAAASVAQSKFGGASGFLDGAGDVFRTPHHASLDAPTGDFTIRGWFRWAAVGTNACLFVKATTTGFYPYQLFYNGGTGKVIFTGYDGANVLQYTVTGTTTIVVNTWYHIAAVRNGSTFRLYINGVQEGTPATFAGTLRSNASDPVGIGAFENATTGLNGFIDDFSFIKGVCLYPSGTTFTVPAAASPDPQRFTATAIQRTNIESSQELSRSNITITTPRNNPVADLYRVVPPSQPVVVQVQQYHDGDGALASLWAGRIMGVQFAGAKAEMSCEPVFTSIKRQGLRRAYQRQCPHVVYGPECGLNRDTFKLATTVTSFSGLTVTPASGVSTEVAGFFAGGYLEYLSNGWLERRFITDHTGGVLTLSTIPLGLSNGQAINVYRGCDHTLTMCASAKFADNSLNYGGFKWMPLKNPFGAAPIF